MKLTDLITQDDFDYLKERLEQGGFGDKCPACGAYEVFYQLEGVVDLLEYIKIVHSNLKVPDHVKMFWECKTCKEGGERADKNRMGSES